MSDLIDRNEVIKKLEQLDWQDSYLPVHFLDMVINEVPIVNVEHAARWIPVTEQEPKLHCPIIDYSDNIPYIPVDGIVTITTENGERHYYVDDGRFLECYAKGHETGDTIPLFLRGKETVIDGEKCYILPHRIKYWLDLPKAPADKEEHNHAEPR